MSPSGDYVCTVISIVPRAIRQEFPGLIPPVYEIPASNGTDPVCKIIGPAMHFVYLDDNRGSIKIPDSPQEVARALCEDFCNSQIGVSPDSPGRPGVFWVNGSCLAEEVRTKHKEKYDDAVRLQAVWMMELVKMADNDWNRYRAHNVVSEFQILVARLLGWTPEQHEWMTQEIKTLTCPSCGTPVGKQIVCPVCRCILKPDEYKNLQFA